jgi:hypothetical protein
LGDGRARRRASDHLTDDDTDQPSLGVSHVTGEDLYASRERFAVKRLTAVIRFDLGAMNLYGYVVRDPINRLDPFGLYGTNDCSYYAEHGGSYCCSSAPWWCNQFPKPPDPNPTDPFDNEGWARCTRQCLQDADRDRRDQQRESATCGEQPNNSGPWNPLNPSWTDHVKCYLECFQDNIRGK